MGHPQDLGLQGRHEGCPAQARPAAGSRSDSEEPGAEDAPELSSESTNAGAKRAEGEATLGMTRLGGIGSPLLVPRSQPPAAPLKTSFVARSSGR